MVTSIVVVIPKKEDPEEQSERRLSREEAFIGDGGGDGTDGAGQCDWGSRYKCRYRARISATPLVLLAVVVATLLLVSVFAFDLRGCSAFDDQEAPYQIHPELQDWCTQCSSDSEWSCVQLISRVKCDNGTFVEQRNNCNGHVSTTDLYQVKQDMVDSSRRLTVFRTDELGGNVAITLDKIPHLSQFRGGPN
jgi:hypothetical protein